jgi:DNA-binding transcriptional LysR family regulator
MVAKYASFKKASEILHISQPALSIQIKKLESQINMKLFYKTKNKIYLSENGLLLYEYTKKIFSLVEEMESAISSHSDYIGGTINLGGSNTPGTYILPIAIGEMKRHYPAVTINLHIANTSEIMTLVENGSLDMAVNGGNCNYSGLIISEELFCDKLVIVASPMNLLCKKDYVDIDDLTGESFVVHEKTSQLYNNYRTFITDQNIPENISMYLGSIDAIKHAVNANLGISIMPFYAVKSEIEMGLLRELKVDYKNFRYPYNLIYNKNKNISYTAKKFIEILKEVCSGLV